MMFPIKSIADLDRISHAAKWQHFEKLVAFIFAENNFEVIQNVILKSNGTKRQFDVVAKANNKTFLIECKKWKSSKEMLSAIKSAVAKHIERCTLYSELHGQETIPLLVTLAETEINEHKGVFIVPVMKLNSFLQEFDTINL